MCPFRCWERCVCEHQMEPWWTFLRACWAEPVHWKKPLLFGHSTYISFYISCKKTTLFMKDVHGRRTCCSFRQGQGQAGSAVPRGSCLSLACSPAQDKLCSWLSVQHSTGCTARVNCGVDLWLLDVQGSPRQDCHLPTFDLPTVYLSQRCCKVQFHSYYIQASQTLGTRPAEHTWPVQGHCLLECIFHKLTLQ